MSVRALELALLQRSAVRQQAEARLRDALAARDRATQRVGAATANVTAALEARERGVLVTGPIDPQRLLLDSHGLQAALDDARDSLQTAIYEEKALGNAVSQAQAALEVARREERVAERAIERRALVAATGEPAED